MKTEIERMNHRTIRTAIAAALLSLLAIGARADLAALVPYTVPVETVKPLALSVMSGESATWQFSFTEGGVAKDLTGAQSAAMAYTRTGVTYQVSGSLHSLTGGVVRVAWVATNATPAGIYNYVLSVVTGNVALCRARGVLTVGPAMEAVDGSAPVWTLDAAIAAESAARLSGDVVALTNWQAVVYSLTNGAALGATALQPSWAATGTVNNAVYADNAVYAGTADYAWEPRPDSEMAAQIAASIDHTNSPSAHADIRAALNASNAAVRAYADAAVNAAPSWIGITNLAASVTVTNVNERPVYLYSTGTVAVAFSGLRTPMPLYLVLRGPDSLNFPGAYYVGGGTFQTNMSNHFVVWKYGTNLFVNAVTATED